MQAKKFFARLLLNMQVKRLFGRCQIVGTRFPIALVHSGGLILEVSSFGTKAKRDSIPTDAAAFLSTPPPKRKVGPLTESAGVKPRSLANKSSQRSMACSHNQRGIPSCA